MNELLSFTGVGALLVAVARAVGLAVTAPVLSDPTTPIKARVTFVLVTSAALAPLLPPMTPIEAALISPIEVGAGALIGWIARLSVSGIAVGGQLIGLSVGLGFASDYSPTAGESASVVRHILVSLGSIAFLAAGGLEAIVRAVAAPPIGSLHIASVGSLLVDRTAAAFADGIALAAPVLLASVVVNLGLALAQRAAPALHVFAINFTAVLIVGALVLIATASDVAGRVLSAGRNAADAIAVGAR